MTFIDALPKAELHVHLEGTLEAEDVLCLAARNEISLPWTTAAAPRAEYNFTGLRHFPRLYWAGCAVLCRRRDFYNLTANYLRRAAGAGCSAG